MSSSYLTPAFEERCFPNPFVNKELKRLNLVEFKVKVRNLKAKLLKELEEKGIEASRSDPTIYTGICGIALLYYKMYGGQGRINDQVFEMIRSAEHPKQFVLHEISVLFLQIFIIENSRLSSLCGRQLGTLLLKMNTG